MIFVFIVLSIVFFFVALFFFRKLIISKRLLEQEQEEKRALESDIENLKSKGKEIAQKYQSLVEHYRQAKTENEGLKTEIIQLEKWRPIVDAEKKAEEILFEAEQRRKDVIRHVRQLQHSEDAKIGVARIG